ncbi:MAG: hypothetical protein ACXVCD_13885 [Pseudobdellovibrionaceae bacterium]
MNIFIFFLAYFLVSSASAIDLCSKLESVFGLKKDAVEILRASQLEALNNDPNSFCNNNMLRSYLEEKSKNKTQISKMSDQEVRDAAKIMNDKERSRGFTSLPLVKDKEGVAATAIMLPEGGSLFKDGKKETLASVIQEAEKVINSDPCKYHNQTGQSFAEVIHDSGLSPQDYMKMMDKALIFGPAIICSEITGVTQALSCSNAFKRMTDKMKQRGNPPRTSMPELLDKIINSGQFDHGLKIAASKIIAKAKHPNEIKADLFTDVRDSFQEAGYSENEATQLTFETLGMIATAGPALKDRLHDLAFDGDRWPTVTALTTIASLTPYLDYYSSVQKRNLYSFPPGISGQCDTSKSYYFWMAAYLARAETLEGTPPEAAAGAAYSAAKAYHVVGNLTDRPGASALFKEDTFSPESNINRVDLAYASAGALYGAGINTKNPINVDNGIARSIEKSVVAPKLSKAEAIEATKPFYAYGYYKFKSMFAPNEIFEAQSKGRNFEASAQAPFTQNTFKPSPKIQCK